MKAMFALQMCEKPYLLNLRRASEATAGLRQGNSTFLTS